MVIAALAAIALVAIVAIFLFGAAPDGTPPQGTIETNVSQPAQ
jgi:hypothetical protein